MNQIFVWLIFIGMIVGVYSALSVPLESDAAAPQIIVKTTIADLDQASTVTVRLIEGWAERTSTDMSDITTATLAFIKSEQPPIVSTTSPKPQTRLKALAAQGKKIGDSIIKMPETAVNILIGLIGPMALWLGVMKVAEEAGLIRLLALALQPILRPLFPRIPRGHPALGAIILNIAANMLGTGNAATPLGLKAMNELQKLNKEKEVATDAMIMFLAMNTSGVTIIPFTVAAFRSSANSTNVFSFLIPTIIATTISTTVAIIAVLIFKRFSRPPDDYFDELAAAEAGAGGSAIDEVYGELQEKQREKEGQ